MLGSVLLGPGHVNILQISTVSVHLLPSAPFGSKNEQKPWIFEGYLHVQVLGSVLLGSFAKFTKEPSTHLFAP